MILEVRHVTALAVRVLDRLLRDNPFTYLPPAQMGKRGELGSLNQPVDWP